MGLEAHFVSEELRTAMLYLAVAQDPTDETVLPVQVEQSRVQRDKANKLARDTLVKKVLQQVVVGSNGEQCVGQDEYFYSESGDSRETNIRKTMAAQALCRQCPLIIPCYKGSIQQEEWYGTWGGVAEKDRRQVILKNRRRKND